MDVAEISAPLFPLMCDALLCVKSISDVVLILIYEAPHKKVWTLHFFFHLDFLLFFAKTLANKRLIDLHLFEP